MGGVGKTKILDSVYQNQKVTKKFDCYAWVSVSASYTFEDLLKRIIKQILEDKGKFLLIDTMDLRQLRDTLRIELQEMRYFIVLDDVWQSDALDLCHAFPRNEEGSKVVITTRNEEVAGVADENHRINLKTLSEEESWDLFCQKAFFTIPGKRCPEGLASWGKEIVAKCQGLPLAIVVIGSMLARRTQEEREWMLFYNQLGWEFTNNPQIKDVLNLSINDLPPLLRNCFLYCGLFPEDADIRRKLISRLWIAEGFVEEKGKDIALEVVAEEYIKALASRCLIQVVEKNVHGRIKRFKMHDLLREVCIAISNKERFSEEARRISVQRGNEDFQPSHCSSTTRSFLLLDKEMSSSSIENALRSFRLLRILSLRFSKIEKVPEVIFELFNLHYLDLSHTGVSEISKSLQKLHYLETLDLRATGVKKLPNELSKLTKLRHLFVINYPDYPSTRAFIQGVGASIPTDICNLRDLQSLQCIRATRDLIRNLRKLRFLRTLHLQNVQQCFIPELHASLAMLPNLANLSIEAINVDNEVLDLNFLEFLIKLEKLWFGGRVEMGILPKVFNSLHKLRVFELHWCGLKEDPIGSFAHMHYLVYLSLVSAYDGEQLNFPRGYFPNLKYLVLIDMAQLVRIEIERESMIKLDYLLFSGLPSLQCVPDGIYFLQSLRKLAVQNMSELFLEKLRSDESRLIQHVPNIIYVN